MIWFTIESDNGLLVEHCAAAEGGGQDGVQLWT